MITQNRYLQFYADKPNYYTNKLFTFKVRNEIDAFRCMLKFAINDNTFRFAAINDTLELQGTKHKSQTPYLSLHQFVEYFNNAEFDHIPTFNEAINDYRMTYGS